MLNAMTVNAGSTVSLRSRSNGELRFDRVVAKFGISLNVQNFIPWVTAEDYFTFHYHLGAAKKKATHIYLQFVMIYDDHWQQRYLRVFNLRLTLVETPRKVQSSRPDVWQSQPKWSVSGSTAFLAGPYPN